MTVRKHLMFVLAAGLVAASLSGCAIFQANPSASDCAKAANTLAAAQTSVTLAQATVTAIQNGGTAAKTVAQAQTDLSAAQAVLAVVEADYAAKCGPPKAS